MSNVHSNNFFSVVFANMQQVFTVYFPLDHFYLAVKKFQKLEKALYTNNLRKNTHIFL